MTWTLRAVLAWTVALGAACSGGDTGGGGGRGGNGSTTPAGGDGSAASGGGTSAAGTFGNSDRPPPNITVMPGTDAGPTLAPDGGMCEVGVFCESNVPDPDVCGTLRLESDIEVTQSPGNLLIIFDQSVSMTEDWAGTGTTKLVAAQNALINAITPLQDLLTVGAIFFPTTACLGPPPPGGGVAPIDNAVQIQFTMGPQFITAWNAHWNTLGGLLPIGTPLNEAFDQADVALQNAVLEGSLAVLVFTDGEPTCFPDPAITMLPTQLETQHAANWLGNGIKTYVVGLPGANGVQILNQIAQSGGTNGYILPDDPAMLEAALAQVVQETVMMGFDSCSITLDPAADVPDELLMIVEEPQVGTQQVPRDRGWSLSDDGAHVEITGALCDDAMNGRFTSITFEYACPEIEPPPPLPPVE